MTQKISVTTAHLGKATLCTYQRAYTNTLKADTCAIVHANVHKLSITCLIRVKFESFALHWQIMKKPGHSLVAHSTMIQKNMSFVSRN